MYKVMAFLSRKPGTTIEQLRDYYETRHVPLIGEIAPTMRGYRRNYLKLNEPFKRNGDRIDFDVVTEMLFASEAEYDEWFQAFSDPDAFRRVVEDEHKFLDPDSIRVCAVEVAETAYDDAS